MAADRPPQPPDRPRALPRREDRRDALGRAYRKFGIHGRRELTAAPRAPTVSRANRRASDQAARPPRPPRRPGSARPGRARRTPARARAALPADSSISPRAQATHGRLRGGPSGCRSSPRSARPRRRCTRHEGRDRLGHAAVSLRDFEPGGGQSSSLFHSREPTPEPDRSVRSGAEVGDACRAAGGCRLQETRRRFTLQRGGTSSRSALERAARRNRFSRSGPGAAGRRPRTLTRAADGLGTRRRTSDRPRVVTKRWRPR